MKMQENEDNEETINRKIVRSKARAAVDNEEE